MKGYDTGKTVFCEKMYSEFIITYIITGIIALLLIAVIVLQCLILRKISSGSVQHTGGGQRGTYSNPYQGGATVICRNCATQYSSSLSVCPQCGTHK